MERRPGLTEHEIALLTRIFHAHSAVDRVKVFGSRAKGTHSARSDVDLALYGDISALQAEAIAAELDELPLPYHFDVKAFAELTLHELREHIERVGLEIYAVPLVTPVA